MLTAVRYHNFRVLRGTTLPVGPVTLIVGANGSGKSTAIAGLRFIRDAAPPDYESFLSVDPIVGDPTTISIDTDWAVEGETISRSVKADSGTAAKILSRQAARRVIDWEDPKPDPRAQSVARLARSIRFFSWDAGSIAAPVQLRPTMEFDEHGGGLVGVVDALRDQHPERFEALNADLPRWLPEFDRLAFNTPDVGIRSLLFRTRRGRHLISADRLSDGSLFAVAMLTLSHLPEPPSVVCIEDVDRGLHPRLLPQLQDAIYRLAYPERFGEHRRAVQVVATTHSPYLLDLFRDLPEVVVIAERNGNVSTLERLSDRPDIDDVLAGAPLGEVWFSGVLGGVPAGA